jgi:hypothetical protein
MSDTEDDGPAAPPLFVTNPSVLLVSSNKTPRHALELKSYLNRGTLPDFFERPGLMQYLQRLATDAALRGDYGEADRYVELNRKFYDACIDKESIENVQQRLEHFDVQLSTATHQLAFVRERWADRLSRLKYDESDHLEKLRKHHETELTQFDEHWKSDEALRPFTKASPPLLEQRQKEKRLLLIKEFQEAAAVAKYIEELERKETEESQLAAETEAVMLRERLMQRQAQELELANRKALAKIAALETRRDQEIEVLVARIAHIKTDRGNVRRSKAGDAELLCKMRSRASDSTGLLSPRSQAKMDEFRKKSSVSRLSLKPIMKIPTVIKNPMRMPKYHKPDLTPIRPGTS